MQVLYLVVYLLLPPGSMTYDFLAQLHMSFFLKAYRNFMGTRYIGGDLTACLKYFCIIGNWIARSRGGMLFISRRDMRDAFRLVYSV